MLEGQAGARADLDLKAVGNCDAKAGGDGVALARRQVVILGGDDIHAGGTGGGIAWQGQALAVRQAGDLNADGHVNSSTI